MVRRTIAAGVAVLVFILLVLAFKGCLNARKERAMEDYVRDSGELVGLSKSESQKLFNTLSAPNEQDQAVNRQNQANELRVESQTIAERARDLDPPDELSSAQDYLVESLELRRDALAVVAEELPNALAQEERRGSTGRIAQMMQVFSASDVLLRSRFKPDLEEALEEEDINAESPRVPRLTFVTNLDWLQPDFVADQIAGIRGGGGTATPGLHGNGLGTVSLGGVALTPGGSATVQLTRDTAFDVQVVNQGDSTETDVVVNVEVGQGADAIQLEETLPEIAAGEAKTVTIPLSEQPPTGQNVGITVSIKPVPGEEVTDNNEGEFTVIFTR
jgi:hypothetical protein